MRVVDAMKAEIDFFSKIEDMSLMKKPKLLLDAMCENSAGILNEYKIDFELSKKMTYKGKNFY